MQHPLTEDEVIEICHQLNVKISTTQSIEAMLHCRVKKRDKSTTEEYSYDKLLSYLSVRIKFMPVFDTERPVC
jgi:hypothetical protein